MYISWEGQYKIFIFVIFYCVFNMLEEYIQRQLVSIKVLKSNTGFFSMASFTLLLNIMVKVDLFIPAYIRSSHKCVQCGFEP